MRRYHNFVMRNRPGERCFLTERQFLRYAADFEDDTMTNRRSMIYAKFEVFEEQFAHCYFMLHERFIANPPLAKFWAETAMDELQHYSILRFCRERGMMAEADVDFRTIERVEELLETVKGIVSHPEVSIDEAFYASLLMESSELDESYEQLIRTLAKDHRLWYDAIRARLRSHHDRVADGAGRYCRDRTFAEAFRMLGKAEREAQRGRRM